MLSKMSINRSSFSESTAAREPDQRRRRCSLYKIRRRMDGYVNAIHRFGKDLALLLNFLGEDAGDVVCNYLLL